MDEAPDKFHLSVETVVETLIELFRAQGNGLACEVLENAKARIEHTRYDNWDGGQYFFTLFLDLPIKVFAQIESDVPKMEKLIVEKAKKTLPSHGSQWIEAVDIKTVIEKKRATPARVAPSAVEHLWKASMFRLFLSHVSSDKVSVSKLKQQLHPWGIDSFVAHEDIEPTLEWQGEIELALMTMHALAALITPAFHQSKWTDQEIGIALGKGITVIPVRLGLDPYGFIGKQQGLSGKLDDTLALASSIVDLLLKNKATESVMTEALIVAFERAKSFPSAIAISKKVEAMKFVSVDHVRRLQTACERNRTVKEAWNVPQRIQQVAERFGGVVSE